MPSSTSGGMGAMAKEKTSSIMVKMCCASYRDHWCRSSDRTPSTGFSDVFRAVTGSLPAAADWACRRRRRRVDDRSLWGMGTHCGRLKVPGRNGSFGFAWERKVVNSSMAEDGGGERPAGESRSRYEGEGKRRRGEEIER